MRILHIIDTLWLGGAQTLLQSVFEYQHTNDNIFVFSLRKTNPQISINHQNATCFNSSNKLSLKRVQALKKYIKKNNIDILHCHLPHAQAMGYFMKKFYFKNIKLIFHEHAEIYRTSLLPSLLLRLSKNKVDKYITCSEHSKLELHRKINIETKRIIVLNNFVNPKLSGTLTNKQDIHKERKKYGFDTGEFVVGFAGRLVKRKGWKEFLLTAKELKYRDEIKFLIAGTGPDKKKLLSTISKSGLSDKITYLGYFRNMPVFYSLIDCLIIPSYWEGMPLVQLEAAAMRVPVICSDAPGLNEIFEKHHEILYTKIHDYMAIKQHIETLYSEKNKYDNLTKNALAKVKQLNIVSYIDKLNEIYKNISHCHPRDNTCRL